MFKDIEVNVRNLWQSQFDFSRQYKKFYENILNHLWNEGKRNLKKICQGLKKDQGQKILMTVKLFSPIT